MRQISSLGLQIFEFGPQVATLNHKDEEITIADWGMHVGACAWRISHLDKIVLSCDEIFLRRKSRFYWRKTPPRDVSARRRWLAAIEFFRVQELEKLIVEAITADKLGGVKFKLAHGYSLELWPVTSSRDTELWRLLPPRGPHFVTESEQSSWQVSALVIATHNKKKMGEMLQILSEKLPMLELKSLNDFDAAPEPEETGATYAENAEIKAQSAAAFTGEWSLADDAGLEIDALAGAPGVHSKRFEGEGTSFPEKMARILERMKEIPDEKRTARFRCCVALAQPDGATPIVTFEATCEGIIAREMRGNNGFGYDPIFFLPDLSCTMAELSSDEKHAISHRGKVLRMLVQHLQGQSV